VHRSGEVKCAIQATKCYSATWKHGALSCKERKCVTDKGRRLSSGCHERTYPHIPATECFKFDLQ